MFRCLLTSITLFLRLLLLLSLAAGCSDDPAPTPCDGVDCDGRGVCRWSADLTAYCDCEPGFILDPEDPLSCIYDPDGNVNNYNNCKPVIYLYPETVTRVRVRFSDPDTMRLTYTYPEYSETGWDVIAQPDGTLTDPVTGRRYYTLFWEGTIAEPEVPAEGFIVAGADTAAFLEELLPTLGLAWDEADEFIIYWLPILGENPYNFITFLTDTYIDAVGLDVTPAPQTVVRIALRYAPLSARPAALPVPQVFNTPARAGFTLVEWGGREVPPPPGLR